jgi:hypothetical protein
MEELNMGYSVNPSVLERRRHLLRNLERGIEQVWVVESDPIKTKRYATDIREALYIASIWPTRYPELAEAHANFTIRVVGPGRIEAKRKVTGTELSGETPIHGIEPQGTPVPSVGVATAYEVYQAWQDHLPSNDPLHFTQVELSDEELAELYNWTARQPTSILLLYDDERRTLTVTLPDAGVEKYAWHPPKPEEKPAEKFDL